MKWSIQTPHSEFRTILDLSVIINIVSVLESWSFLLKFRQKYVLNKCFTLVLWVAGGGEECKNDFDTIPLYRMSGWQTMKKSLTKSSFMEQSWKKRKKMKTDWTRDKPKREKRLLCHHHKWQIWNQFICGFAWGFK